MTIGVEYTIIYEVKSNHRIVLLLFLAFCEILIHFFITLPGSQVNIYFLRDINRSLELLNGHFIFVGPDFTSGHFLFGPFFYWLLAPVTFFSASPVVVAGYFFTIKVTAQILFSDYFARNLKIPFLFIYLIISSVPFFCFPLSWPNNAALIAPAIQFACIGVYSFYSNKFSLRLLVVNSLLLALLMQIHFSLALLWPFYITIVFLKEQESKLRVKYLCILFLTFLLSLTPFIVSILAAYFSTGWAPIIFSSDLGIFYFFRNWAELLVKHIFNAKIFELATYRGKEYFFDLFFVYIYLILRGLWHYFNRKYNSKLEMYCIITVIIALFFVPWLFTDTYRYLIPVYSFSLFIFMYDLSLFISKSKRKKILFIAIGLIVAFMGRALNYTRSLNLKNEQACFSCFAQLQTICDYFNSKNISFEEFSSRTYQIVNRINEGGLYSAEYCFDKRVGISKEEHASYLFISSSESLENSLENLPPEIRTKFKLASLRLEVNRPGFKLFKQNNLEDWTDQTQQRLSNLTNPYEIDPAFGVLGVERKLGRSDNEIFFSRLCRLPFFCDVFIVKRNVPDGLNLYFHSRLFQSIYLLKPVVGFAANLSVDFKCDTKVLSMRVASRLGTFENYFQNQTLFMPIGAYQKVKCSSVELLAITIEKLEIFYPYYKKYELEKVAFPILSLSNYSY